MLSDVGHSALGCVFHRVIVWGLLASFFMPASLVGDEPTIPTGTDIVLYENGTLRGCVVDGLGLPIGSATVRILHKTRLVAVTTTDETGYFSMQSLRNGTHVIQTDGAMQVIRLWGKAAAPPTASENITIVVRPDPLVRGQAASTPGLLGNPWFIAGVVGVAVGTILIIDDQNDDGNNRRTSPVASP